MFVQRSKKENATAALNKALKKAKDSETSLLIFPEGTRHLASSDGECMLPFKNGWRPLAPFLSFDLMYIQQQETVKKWL